MTLWNAAIVEWKACSVAHFRMTCSSALFDYFSKRDQGIAFLDKQSEVRERKMRIGSFVCPNGSGLQRLATNAYRIASEGWTPQPGHCEQLDETRRQVEDEANLTYAQLDRHASSSQASPAVPKFNLSDSLSEFSYDRTIQPHVAQMAGGQTRSHN